MAERYSTLYALFSEDFTALEQEIALDVYIHRDNVVVDMVTQPGLYVKWARLAVYAESEYSRIKQKVNEQIWTNCRDAARKHLETQGERATEGKTNDLAYQNPQYLVGCEQLREAKLLLETFKKVENAMFQRKDMLQSLNSRNRAEFEDLPPEALPRERTTIRSVVPPQRRGSGKPERTEIDALIKRYLAKKNGDV